MLLVESLLGSSSAPAANYIEDVFSTWLYTGTGASQTITNGVNLSSKGGLVWMKGRSGATDHALYDTARGATFDIGTNLTTAQTTQATGLTAFGTTGFTIGSLAKINTNAATYTSWTFRKQAKFFDVVTYTGNGTGQNVSHSLGAVPGCIIVKRIAATSNWQVYHRGLTSAAYSIGINSTAAQASNPTCWNSTAPTSSVFTVGGNADVNANGVSYVAYLFAHNAGGFGLNGTDNVISCGTFNNVASGATVNLGYEPQFIIFKNSSASGSWFTNDSMRGMPASGGGATLQAEALNAESTGIGIGPTATGFTYQDASFGNNADVYIYIAIRRGPMKTPTTGTSVFGLNARTGTGANVTVTGGQTDDTILIKNRGAAYPTLFSSRLTGTGYLIASGSSAETAAGTTILQANPWDVMDGVKVGTTDSIANASANTYINYLIRRAPGFFDTVCYTGTGAARTISHNLGAVPQLIIVKSRSLGYAWEVYYGDVTKLMELNSTGAAFNANTLWNSTAPTASVFSVGNNITVNESTTTYIAYLFGTVAGVSKVGTYTGMGGTTQINCGFTGGARFIMIKRIDAIGPWYVWDTARGIVAGNDPYFLLNSTAVEVTGLDFVDTYSAGFELSSAATASLNALGGNYLFLAIA
jgi:hypothetical protein